MRIFERECRSLANSGQFHVYLAAAGQIPADSGVSLIPLKTIPSSRSVRFVRGPRRAWGLSRAISADLWHFHDPELLPVAIELARTGHAVIWDAHEDYLSQFTDEDDKAWVPGPIRGLVRRGLEWMLQEVDQRAAGIVAASGDIARGYRNRRTVVVGNGARLETFRDCHPSFTARRVLFTGHVGAGHLFNEVVEAVASLPNVTLAVAGREPDVRLWTTAEARLGGRLTHLGWLNREELASAIGQASVGLATYADRPSYGSVDPSPNKLYEFCAAGLPVVASPNPANIRFMEEGCFGFLSAGFAADSIALAIEAALADAAVWEQASTRGRDWATRFGSWSPSEMHLLDLYSDILGV